MKKTFLSLIFTGAMIFLACNNGTVKNDHEGHDMTNDTTPELAMEGDKEVKAVEVVYTDVDAKAAASIKEIVANYLNIKNALANDNAGEAASGAKAMESSIIKLDKSLLTAQQKTAYDKNEEELKAHASHIVNNGNNISLQRSHFAMMSKVTYDLVKSFGGGRLLYHDHCPMYNENKGAMWLSELKEVKNPYFGSEMLSCGSVEEMIK